MPEETNIEKLPIKKDSDSGDLKSLIEKNIKWSQVIYEQNKKMNRRLTWMVAGSYLRLAIILIPLILALIFLPPFLQSFMEQYSSLLGIGNVNVGSTQLNDILQDLSPAQLQEALKLLGR